MQRTKISQLEKLHAASALERNQGKTTTQRLEEENKAKDIEIQKKQEEIKTKE